MRDDDVAAPREIHDLPGQCGDGRKQREGDGQHQRATLSQADRQGSFAGGCICFQIRDTG